MQMYLRSFYIYLKIRFMFLVHRYDIRDVLSFGLQRSDYLHYYIHMQINLIFRFDNYIQM